MLRLTSLSFLLLFVSVAPSASAQSYGRSDAYSYLPGESYFPYAYQRHAYPHVHDYGYQYPANGYVYPYNNGEHYSPYTYRYQQDFDNR